LRGPICEFSGSAARSLEGGARNNDVTPIIRIIFCIL
jgi:hypothetical protein